MTSPDGQHGSRGPCSAARNVGSARSVVGSSLMRSGLHECSYICIYIWMTYMIDRTNFWLLVMVFVMSHTTLLSHETL